MSETPDAYEILERAAVYQGYFRIDRYRLRYARFGGGWSEPLRREVFERGHAAVVLPYDPVRDEVVLIEQFRAGALDAPGGPWVIEPVAGVIEPGEAAAGVARREAVEEAGVVIDDLIPIAECLMSPGGTSERQSLFCGRVDASAAGGLFGLADEGEDIRAFVMDFATALAALEARETTVASLLIAMFWLARHREAVRRRWSTPADPA